MEQTKKGMTPQEIEGFKKKIRTNDGLYFGRIPAKTKEEFSAWAKEEFCGDYGMALKWLWDDMKNSGETNVLLLRLQQLEQRIQVLENPVIETMEQVDPKKVKTMVDGSKKKVKK